MIRDIKNFKIFWLPTIAYWTLLITCLAKVDTPEPKRLAPLIIYFIASSIFVLSIQNEIIKSKDDIIKRVTRSRIYISCLLISSIIILIDIIFISTINGNISTILILLLLVISTIYSGSLSYAQDQLNEKFQERSKERKYGERSQREWREYLIQINSEYPQELELKSEIERINNILNYSSFFRTEESTELLYSLRSMRDSDEIIQAMKRVE